MLIQSPQCFGPRTTRFRRRFRCLPLILLVAPWGAALADSSAATAATTDWRSWDELPADVQARTAPWCGGNYLDPLASGGSDGLLGSGLSPDSEQPLTVSGQEGEYIFEESVSLRGDVRLNQGQFEARGDFLDYRQDEGEVRLEGGVQSRGQGFLITGEEAYYRVSDGDFRLNTATFLLHDAHMRGSARMLRRTGPESLSVRSGVMTTCPPDNRAWSLEASFLNLDQDSGFGTARNVRLRVHDVPVFYVPWMSFPIDDRRKTGFLYPTVGNSNAGNGLMVSSPYYLNLAPHYDLTYTPTYIHGRGLHSELEGRHLASWGPSELSVGFIDRDSEYRDLSMGRDGQRWGLNLEHRATLPNNWRGRIDVGAVSDDDYIRDLDQGLGLDRTTHLERVGQVSWSGPGVRFDGVVRGFQTLDDSLSGEQRPYYQLPELNLMVDQRQNGFRWGGEAQYTYFWRDNDDLSGRAAANGSRLRAKPALSVDWRRQWGYLRPGVMLDHTEYVLEDLEPEDRFTRTVPFVDLDAGLYFDRSFRFQERPYLQTLEPRLYYVYSPARDQDDIPVFDTRVKTFSFDQLFSRDRFTGGDRIGDNNRVTSALTSRFFDLNRGLEWASVSVGRIYHWQDREVTLDGRGGDTATQSPLAGEVRLQPREGLDLRYATLWDPNNSRTVRARTQVRYRDMARGYLVNAAHTYDAEDLLEQTDLGVVIPVGQQTRLIGRWVYDLGLERTAGSLVGVEYTACCWQVQLVTQRYRTADQVLDNRLLFQVQLRGLGSSGGAAGTVADAIPGFEERTWR